MARYISDFCVFLRRRIYLISWISLILYLFYKTFIFYLNGRQFYYLRRMLGIGLCVSRGTATVLNLSCALVLLPLCKKLNQLLYRAMSKLCPGLFFFWLESAKSFHMTVAITLVLFAVIHSVSHFVNLWNFSRHYEEDMKEINMARYRNESPLLLLMSITGVTGVSMLIIVLCMGLTSTRFVRRRVYNAFWYIHQLYLPFMVLLMIHPLSGILKEEIFEESGSYINTWTNSTILIPNRPTFAPIKAMTWIWMALPLSCFLLDLVWRIFSRNLARVKLLKVIHMTGRTLSLTLSCPHAQFSCRKGQYVLMQCSQASVLEWHPFTVVEAFCYSLLLIVFLNWLTLAAYDTTVRQEAGLFYSAGYLTIPLENQKEFVIWIKVKGDWTECLEKLINDTAIKNITILVDGPFSSPMEGISSNEIAICVAAGVGITPFVSVLRDMLVNPRSRLPGRLHLIWIVRYESELNWIAKLANDTILNLRSANRLDRLHLELYVTNTDDTKYITNVKGVISHMVVVNEKGDLSHVIDRSDNEKTTLLTPNMKRNGCDDEILKGGEDCDNYQIAKAYPVVGCRVKRGRPHWDRVFGYWMHLYPEEHLNLYCCGPKKLVKLLRSKCKYASRLKKTRFSFIHEGFS